MDGILVIDKPKGYTSRDVVNIVSKQLNTKKIGHTGTLDPLATGVLVLCIGKATKLVELLTCDDKEYIADVKIGIKTDTYDIDGNVIERSSNTINQKLLKRVVDSYKKTYKQQVPIYSAVKVNGKKLYEYARENKSVILPSRMVAIKDIKLLESNDDTYKFYAHVSKGTYIRSLINDINNDMHLIGVMSDLRRIRQGMFTINNSYTLEDIKNNNYKLIGINNILINNDSVRVDNELYKKIKNGSLLDNIYNKDLITFVYKDNVIAIYETYSKDKTKIKPYRMFI